MTRRLYPVLPALQGAALSRGTALFSVDRNEFSEEISDDRFGLVFCFRRSFLLLSRMLNTVQRNNCLRYSYIKADLFNRTRERRESSRIRTVLISTGEKRKGDISKSRIRSFRRLIETAMKITDDPCQVTSASRPFIIHVFSRPISISR